MWSPALGERRDRQMQRRHAAGGRDRADAAFSSAAMRSSSTAFVGLEMRL